MPLEIVCIVEGHGEVQALPVLIRRIRPDASVLRPLRVTKSQLLSANGLENGVKTAATLVASANLILILMDADKDCPAQLGPSLLQRAKSARGDRNIVVVVAKVEFENWFLAAAKSTLLSHDRPASTRPRVRSGGSPGE